MLQEGTMPSLIEPGRELLELKKQCQQVFLGSPLVVDLVLTAWLAGGHVLLEDRPGVGKTTLAKTLSSLLAGTMQRVQGSPDLTPSDVIGMSLYDQTKAQFVFQPGPIFSNILLFDELNRCPPRCLSSLLEAMAEGQVSVDGTSHQLHQHFFCLATQNPFDAAGTYTLPQSQLDRFMLRVSLGYPDPERERQLLQQGGVHEQLAEIEALLSPGQQENLRQQCRDVHVDETIQDYF